MKIVDVRLMEWPSCVPGYVTDAHDHLLRKFSSAHAISIALHQSSALHCFLTAL